MIRILALLALAAAFTAPVSAPTAAPALSAADRAAVARAQDYLNGMRTLRARFAQHSTNGGYAEGKLYLRRPGRLRLDYKPPAKIQIYADGLWLIYVDTELKEATHVPLSSTLAGFLVRKNISLTGKVTVTKVERESGMVRVHLVQTKEPETSTLVLNFSESPFELRSWLVTDAQGTRTRVTLMGTEINISIAGDVFHFDASKFDRTWNE